MAKKITIALAGNPNSGKTTVFNNLTGTHQHVGNYPGVTVETIEGKARFKGYDIRVVDLPGTYSLSASSADEVVARNFVIEQKPDVVVDIIDSSNLERNLYLAVQFIELGIPLILVFNMYDIAKKNDFAIDKERLSTLLGSPVVFTVATEKKGMEDILDKVIEVVNTKELLPKVAINYGGDITGQIDKLTGLISQDEALLARYPPRWLAVKLLENDAEIIKKISKSSNTSEIAAQGRISRDSLYKVLGDTAEDFIADRRYGFISGAVLEAVVRNYQLRHSRSDMIDKVLIHPILGLPIFLTLMWAVFRFGFTLSLPVIKGVEKLLGLLGGFAGTIFPPGSVMYSLVVDGIIAGVGSVLSFVPVIAFLFLAMAFLEDSGYMARAAFIMDRFMHKIGLHGRSFIPVLLGLGCNVPAIMAARSIDDERDRLVTILINPFISCGARLPIYVLFIGTFFSPGAAGNVLFSLYVLGMIVAAVMAKIFRKYFFKGEAAAFVMELPPYRMPTLKTSFIHMWQRVEMFLKKAGTIIFLGSILIWGLSNFPAAPKGAGDDFQGSYAARVGRVIAPVFKPLGFDDWRVATGLIGGIVGKEIMISTLATLYSIDNTDQEFKALGTKLRQARRSDGTRLFSPLRAYSLLVFILLYIPCLGVIAVIRKETNSWRWPVFTAVYTTAVAWIAAFIVYQGGRLLGLG